MSNVLVVFGATGQQGSSVIDYVLEDSTLSKKFKVRAVTRDPSQPAAQALEKRGVEVVKADVNDDESVKRATAGAHTVFLVTVTNYDEHLKETEFSQVKRVADTAVSLGASYFIFSTLPHPVTVSAGRYKNFDVFISKAEAEQYIRTLPIKSAFFAPGFFMQNLHSFMMPQPLGNGSYAISNFIRPETKLPLIEIVADTGKFVGVLLAEPDKYVGKVLSAATALWSLQEVADTISKVSGKTVKYNQIPEDVFRGYIPFPPVGVDNIMEMFAYYQDPGYFGPDSKELVEWTVERVTGKLSTLEEYLVESPLKLD
ncbi:hypothetical protein F5884DRAFT_793115 [Xylogone sp. PMI_703]|nr:hypothetical protein F5884DRAFT_793115 [Xylogone sp. PMI_703]